MTVTGLLAICLFCLPVLCLFIVKECGVAEAVGGIGRIGSGIETASAKTNGKGQKITFVRMR